jgi:hypothetical protein
MAGSAKRRWWLLAASLFALPMAAAATLTISDGTVGSGMGTPGTCESGVMTVNQNVGTVSPNTTNVVSLDVSGIGAACAGGTVWVTLSNNADPVQEASATIPAGGGSVNLPLTTAVPLKDAHFLAVTLQGP